MYRNIAVESKLTINTLILVFKFWVYIGMFLQHLSNVIELSI